MKGEKLETLLHFMERVHERSEMEGSHKMELEFLIFRIEPRSRKKNLYFKEYRRTIAKDLLGAEALEEALYWMHERWR